jgi:hypothetical protein
MLKSPPIANLQTVSTNSILTTINPYLDIETKVIKRFIIKDKQDRYLQFIKDDRLRQNFTNELAHFLDLKYDLFEEVKGDERAFIKNRIKSLPKIKDCYLISEDTALDQQLIDVDTALSKIIGFGMGALLVFGDADLIYYESEGPSDRWITKTVYQQRHY